MHYIYAIVEKKNGFYQAYHKHSSLQIKKCLTKEEAKEEFVKLLQGQYSIIWFDPYKNFKMGDTAFMNDNRIYTFLAYKDEKALVMANDCEELLVNPEDLRPCYLYGWG